MRLLPRASRPCPALAQKQRPSFSTSSTAELALVGPNKAEDAVMHYHHF